jgi:hypothetical protein
VLCTQYLGVANLGVVASNSFLCTVGHRSEWKVKKKNLLRSGLSLFTHHRRQDLPVRGSKRLHQIEVQSQAPNCQAYATKILSSSGIHSSTPLHHFAAATVPALYYSCWCSNPLAKLLMVNNFGHNLDGQWQALTHGILVQLEIFDLLLCEYIHRMSNSSIIFIASN